MFEKNELLKVLLASLLMAYLIAFSNFTLINFVNSFILSVLILFPHVVAHKIAASFYDSESKFDLLEWKRYWFLESAEFKYPFPIWLVLPIIVVLLTLGKIKIFAIEVAKISWKKRKRIGRWFTELQEYEIANIALAGPLINLAIAFISGIIFLLTNIFTFKEFAILNAWFAFFSLIPLGSLDGTKVLFGGLIRFVVVFVLTTSMLVLLYFINVLFAFVLAIMLAILAGIWMLKVEFWKF